MAPHARPAFPSTLFALGLLDQEEGSTSLVHDNEDAVRTVVYRIDHPPPFQPFIASMVQDASTIPGAEPSTFTLGLAATPPEQAPR